MAPERRTLVQTLILNRTGEVLLCLWKEGACEGRYTGCLGDASKASSDECSARDVVRALTGLELNPERFVRVADFTFEETTENGDAVYDCDEVEFIYRASRRECQRRRDAPEVQTTWVKVDSIPFDIMPADDALWYPLVLGPNGKRLTGRFRFDGDSLEEHTLREVPDAPLEARGVPEIGT